MANVEIDTKAFEDYIDETIVAKLELIGAFIDSEIVKNIKKNFSTSHQMLNSRSNEVNKQELYVRNAVHLVYAAIHELGGIIKPDKAGALTIPVHPDALRLVKNGGSARDMTDLVLISRPGKPALLVRKIEKGRRQRFDVMFVLVKQSQIPARPYIRPAVYDNTDKIMGILAR